MFYKSIEKKRKKKVEGLQHKKATSPPKLPPKNVVAK
jgi:hypothetical protein